MSNTSASAGLAGSRDHSRWHAAAQPAAAVLLGLANGFAVAQPAIVVPAEMGAVALPASALVVRAPPPSPVTPRVDGTLGSLEEGRAPGRPSWVDPRSLTLTIVEFPREPLPGLSATGRPHHGISIGSDAVRDAVRSLGVDAADCATQFRMPSHLRQKPRGG